ncbi:MAG: endonuclease/exonuclease/phosphatase family protein [Bryobacterales bacterium]
MRTALSITVVAFALWATMRRATGAASCAEPELIERPPAGAHSGSADEPLTVVSINIAKQTDEAVIAAEIERHEILRRADVLALQEVRREDGKANVALRLAERLNMAVLVGGAGDGMGPDSTDAVALLSRYPLSDPTVIRLPQNSLGIRSRCRVALAATVGHPTAATRVIGLHLDTRINTESRMAQLEPALADAHRFEGPVVFAGDFNTNKFLWLEHLIPVPFVQDQVGPVVERMAQLGFRTPFEPGGQATNDFLGLQLDWVFLRGLDAAHWGVQPLDFSDHHAVWVRTKEQ